MPGVAPWAMGRMGPSLAGRTKGEESMWTTTSPRSVWGGGVHMDSNSTPVVDLGEGAGQPLYKKRGAEHQP
jgi:hypothetical protein